MLNAYFSKEFHMMKIIGFILVCLIAVMVIGYAVRTDQSQQVRDTDQTTKADYKDASYVIEGKTVQLANGYSESEAAPGSATKVITRYFGNELFADLDGDGDEDVAFILTQETGGSGTFYYGVAALTTPEGANGSDVYFLGDRIAPQPTMLSANQNQKEVVVFNYAARAGGESMNTEPSIGKSVYLKINPDTMRWGIVMPNFEGESALN